jgi:hypothetical protein
MTMVDDINDAIVDEALKPFNVVAIRLPTEQLRSIRQTDPEYTEIPDEEEEEDEHPVNIKFMVTKSHFTPEDERGVTAAFQKIFDNHRLTLCRKCNLFYNPVNESACFRFFHKGQRIPFPDTREMEEIEMDTEGDEPGKIYNWSCCGIRPADDNPINCGKESNGNHEEDPAGGGSAFLCEKKTVGDPEFQ